MTAQISGTGTAAQELDTSALDVLLQELVGDLPAQVSELLNNESLHEQILQYLHEVSSIESQDYLSSVPPTPGMDVQEERTLVQDIAELEATQRSIDMKLKSVIVQSQQLIIDNKTELAHSTSVFNAEFASNLKALRRTFNEDDLEDMKEPQDLDLQELEADLEPDDKDKTFRTIVSNVKKLVSADEEGKHKNNNLSIVLENMEQILNILELPSLTGTCIKAGYYSEALEISSYTRRLAIRFPHSDLIKEVEVGIKTEMSHMLIGLIRLLRTNLKQSSIIKIVSYLRRIQPFSQASDADDQLKRILLHARYQFIKFELDSLRPLKESELHEKFVKRTIEVIREHCFGSIMAFKNIFPDINDEELGHVEIEIEAIKEDSKTEGSEEGKVMESSGVSVGSPEVGPGTEAAAEAEKVEMEKAPVEAEIEQTEKPIETDHEEMHDVSNSDYAEKAEEGTEEMETEKAKLLLVELPSEISKSEPIEYIRPSSQRHVSNVLLVDFVRHIMHELATVLSSSLPQIKETSTRDGLYLQMIYCSHSLGRIDQNFSDLMTAVLLNAKEAGDTASFLVERTAWAAAAEKQKQMAKNLLSR